MPGSSPAAAVLSYGCHFSARPRTALTAEDSPRDSRLPSAAFPFGSRMSSGRAGVHEVTDATFWHITGSFPAARLPPVTVNSRVQELAVADDQAAQSREAAGRQPRWQERARRATLEPRLLALSQADTRADPYRL